jgi:hypothetical protein
MNQTLIIASIIFKSQFAAAYHDSTSIQYSYYNYEHIISDKCSYYNSIQLREHSNAIQLAIVSMFLHGVRRHTHRFFMTYDLLFVSSRHTYRFFMTLSYALFLHDIRMISFLHAILLICH